MNRRNLILLTVLALLSIVAAGIALWQSNRSNQSLSVDRTLFPDLAKQTGDVVRIEIVGGAQTIVIARSDKSWVLPQKDDYPANDARAGQLIATLAHMSLMEKKTANATRYGELNLAPPSKDLNAGTEVKLIDAKGDVIADAIIGRAAPDLGRVGGGFYVRRTDQPESWLVEGNIAMPLNIMEWAARDIFDLYDPRAIKSAAIESSSGKTIVTVKRKNPEDESFSVTPSPPGKTDQGKALRLITLPVSLPFDDVELQKGGDIKPARSLVFKSFAKDVEYSLVVYGDDKDAWVKAYMLGPSDAAKRFNEYHGKWLYKLPPIRAELLNASLSDFSIKDQSK